MSRWLAIDHGTKRIGVAVGDAAGGVVSPLEVLPAQPLALAIEQIKRLADEYGATGLVVGWPINMDDTEGPQAKLARQMGVQLAGATGLDVRLWDERLTSFEADQALIGQYTRKQKKQRQDAIAAAAILRDFFAGNGPVTAAKPGDVANGGDSSR